jgi:hypothetical protein
MTFFPKTRSGSPKIGTFVVLKFWTFIFSSNKACFEHAKAISYNPQKDFFNDVLHTSIGDHLTLL